MPSGHDRQECEIADSAGKGEWWRRLGRYRMPVSGGPPVKGPRRGRSSTLQPRRRKSNLVTEIVISDGAELKERLLAEGLDPGEIILKYLWPRYAPPPGAGIRSIVKSEHLRPQFERLVSMHQIVQSSVPMPVGVVLNPDREFVGYVLEYVEGVTLEEIIQAGMLEEARRRVEIVEETIGKLHAKSVPHGDVNASNVIVADDGRTLLIDPVPFAKPQMVLQDDLCLEELRRRIEPAEI